MDTVTTLKSISFEWESAAVILTKETQVYETLEDGYVKINSSTKTIYTYYSGDDYSSESVEVRELIAKYWELKNG